MNYEKLVRRIRQRIFDYYDESETKGQKAQKLLARAITKMCEQREKQMTPQEREERELRQILAKNPWLTRLDLVS